MRFSYALFGMFEQEKWFTNLLLLAVCMFIPVVGPIVLLGFFVYGLSRSVRDETAPWPRFDFNRFGDYLKWGVWPFLAALAVSLVLIPFVFILALAPIVLGAALDGKADEGVVVLIAMGGSMLAHLVMGLVMVVIVVPIMLGAGLGQSFGAGFNFRFIKSFVGTSGLTLIWTHLVLFLVYTPLSIIGLLMCYLPAFLVGAWFMFAQWRLIAEIYRRHLANGGLEVAMSRDLVLDADESVCWGCGYDLRGNPEASACPECGHSTSRLSIGGLPPLGATPPTPG